MGDSTDRRKPLYHSVPTVKGVAMVHPLEGEDAGGCGASRSGYLQHPAFFQVPSHSRYVGEGQQYVVHYRTNGA